MGNFKRKIRYYFVRNKNDSSLLYKVLVKVNLLLFHFTEREVRKSYGKSNPEKVFYVIRGGGREEGLLSLFIGALEKISYAKRMNYIPFIDMKNYPTQYNIQANEEKTNSWEYYFTQPTKYREEDVYSSKNVILTGWNTKLHEPTLFMGKMYSENQVKIQHDFIKDNLWFSKDLLDAVKKEESSLSLQRTLGVFLRGTDYAALKPKGHFKQPSIDEVIVKVEGFIKKYDIEAVYLVTEDYNIYDKIISRFGTLVKTTGSNYIKDYKNDEYISKYLYNTSKDKNDKSNISKGMEYLVRIKILSDCGYLVSSLASGSIVALALNGNAYLDKYVFDIGLYD